MRQVLAAAERAWPARHAGLVPLSTVLRGVLAEIRNHHGLPGRAVRLNGADAAVRGDATELAVCSAACSGAVKYSGTGRG